MAISSIAKQAFNEAASVTNSEGELVGAMMPKMKHEYQIDDPEKDNYLDPNEEYVKRMMKACPTSSAKARQDYINLIGNTFYESIKPNADDHDDKANRSRGIKDKKSSYDAEKDKKANYNNYELWMAGVAIFSTLYEETIELAISDKEGIEIGRVIPFIHRPGLDENVPANSKIIQKSSVIKKDIRNAFAAMADPVREFWAGGLLGGLGSYKSAFYSFAVKLGRETVGNNVLKSHKSISIDGNTAWKMIPPLAWFSDDIKEIDVKTQLLGILPEAEADTTLLHIGRIAAGMPQSSQRKSTVIEFQPEHQYRAALLISGDPGLGKSSIWEFVEKGLLASGYECARLGVAFNQFSWDVFMNDFVLMDEMNPKQMTEFFNSSQIKSAISGSRMPNERKGIEKYDFDPNAALVVLANQVRLNFKEDPGIVDRVHILSTKTRPSVMGMTEIDEQGKEISYLTRQRWNYLADKHMTTIEVLAMYLIRRGLDYYIEKLGYKKTEDGTWVQNVENKYANMSDLQLQLSHNRNNYVFKAPRDIKSVLTDASRKALLVNEITKEFTNFRMHSEFDMAFNIFHLFHLSEVVKGITVVLARLETQISEALEMNDMDIAEKQKQYHKMYSEILNWIIPRDFYLVSTFVTFQNNFAREFNIYENADTAGNPVPFEAAWDKYIKLLTSVQGYRPDEIRPYYNDAFTNSKSSSGSFNAELLAILSKYDKEPGHIKNLAQRFLWMCSAGVSND